MLKLDDTTGEVLWSQHYASSEGVSEAVMAVVVDDNDDVIGAGRAAIGAAQDQVLTMKLDGASGDILWMETFGGTDNQDDLAWEMAMGADNQPVLAGQVINSGGVAEYFVRKIRTSDGSVVWDERGPEAQNNATSQGTWLELMDNGDAVLCQRVFGNNGYDVFLKRFDAATGGTVWQTTYDGPTHGGDDPRAMAQDSAGNLLVAGVQDANWNYDFMALKVNGETGETMWAANYDGPPGWYDVGTAVTESADGSVVVTGLSDGNGTAWDWATVAFDPADGSQQWVMRHDGTAGQSDEPSQILAGPTGELIVTGYGYGEGTNQDLITLCYQTNTLSAADRPPLAAALQRVWPNPFNPRVNFRFSLPAPAHARLGVFDLRGRRVATLVDRHLDAGVHDASWDGRGAHGRNAPAGVYLAIMESGDQRECRKIILAK
ncbi:hypothetical protein CSB20_01945 [bacterium DOLZORAL124_64_63]|nr:MAG: hypothetical protein CSB20_01945 [bacterium DOLZORAL124_64_63]